jgi:hypothetical protein
VDAYTATIVWRVIDARSSAWRSTR